MIWLTYHSVLLRQFLLNLLRAVVVLFAVFVENGLFLPVFQYPGLGGNNIQLFLDLGKEGFGGAFLLLVRQGQVHLDPRQVIREAALAFLRAGLADNILIFG